jgi:hypothetical protein
LKTNGISHPGDPNASHIIESSLQLVVNHLLDGSVPTDDSSHTWRSDDATFDLSPQTFDVDVTRDHTSDDDDDDDRLYYNFEMSDDQKQATSELYNLKLDLGFTAGWSCLFEQHQ